MAQRARRSGLRSVVIRAGDFFGGGRGSLAGPGDRQGPAARASSVYPGPLDVPHAWAYLPDLARAFERVAQHPARLDGAQVFHFAGHALTGRTGARRWRRLRAKPAGCVRTRP